MIKRPQKKATTKPKLNSRGGFKVVPAPNDANRRQLLSSPDITASGGCRTVQHQTARCDCLSARALLESRHCGPVAQLGEHCLCKAGVVGSIPIGSIRPGGLGNSSCV